MFEVTPLITDLLLTSGDRWLPETLVEAPLRVGSRLVTPDEPSTIALAVVGAASVVIYLAARGVRQFRRSSASMNGAGTIGTARSSLNSEHVSVPKRGAA